MYTHNWVTLLYSRNSIVNQLCSNKNFKKVKNGIGLHSLMKRI